MEFICLIIAGFLLPFSIILFFINPFIGGILFLIVYLCKKKGNFTWGEAFAGLLLAIIGSIG